ncbi:MAG: TIGR00159 family protein [Candidatus Omnitrophica bacterium]|nr:TIGR00159 family protein [Candidatus Omnitrophota bacterium]
MIMGYLLGWEAFLEIFILWIVYYMSYLLIKGTAAEQVLKGLIIISFVIILTKGLNLVIINWLLTRLLAISVLAFLIIFQPELRRGLARIGRIGVFSGEIETLKEVSKAAIVLAKKKTGALIAIEREVGLRRYVESGVNIDSKVTSELINTIFNISSPLHDGGIIVSEQRLEAAACLFPLTQNPNIPKTMGTRHRAAMGLSEETDAVVITVSEETGHISIAVGGNMTQDIEPRSLDKILEKLYMPKIRAGRMPTFLKKILSRGKGEK